MSFIYHSHVIVDTLIDASKFFVKPVYLLDRASHIIPQS